MSREIPIDSLFGELPEERQSKPKTESVKKAIIPESSVESLIPGLDEFLVRISSEEAEKQSEKLVTERLKESVRLYGHSSKMNTQAAAELWKSVIVRAYKDAIGLDLLLTNEDSDSDDEDRVTDPKSVQERGLRWFINFSEDFRNVCWFAGYEPDRVQTSCIAQFERRGLVYLTTKGRWKIDEEELGPKETEE